MTDLIFQGVNTAADFTESVALAALQNLGADAPMEFPNTVYGCPAVHAFTGMELRRAGDLPACLSYLRSMVGTPDAGLAALLYAEISDLLRSNLRKEKTGFVPDAVIRSLGVPLVTGDLPGIAIIMGSAKCAAHVSVLAQNYREKGLAVFLAGAVSEQAEADELSFALGKDVQSSVHALSAIVRIAQIFCAVMPGEPTQFRDSVQEKIPVFVNFFGTPDAASAAVLSGFAALGIPVIADMEQTAALIASDLFVLSTAENMATASLEKRGIKVRPAMAVLPVDFDSSYEGEYVRDRELAVEFSPACELVTAVADGEVEDHRCILLGQELPERGEAAVTLPLGISIRVSGKGMKPEFEPVIERKIHTWLSWLSGVEHRGQRDQLRLRISCGSRDAGLRLADLAELLYVMVRREFETVVDQCAVTLMTDAAAAAAFAAQEAKTRFCLRDARLAAMTDENTDTYYSCTMCQSIAPRHCCVLTPERSGMCGAVTWPDAAATYELIPTGPNRPVEKGECRDAELGGFAAVDRAVADATGGAVTKLSLYSMMEDPMTGCSRMECVCGVEPFSGGVVVVDRDYSGMTPVGMPYEDLASMTSGGVQCPGFMGVGRQYIISPKFIRADGGTLRIVWMPSKLKEELSSRLNQTAEECYGVENFSDMICDETITVDPEELLAFLQEKAHPVLAMDALM